MKTKTKIIIIISSFFVFIFGLYFVMNWIYYTPPSTRQIRHIKEADKSRVAGETILISKFYMINLPPDDLFELNDYINEYIATNKILENTKENEIKNHKSYSFDLYFFRVSSRMPYYYIPENDEAGFYTDYAEKFFGSDLIGGICFRNNETPFASYYKKEDAMYPKSLEELTFKNGVVTRHDINGDE